MSEPTPRMSGPAVLLAYSSSSAGGSIRDIVSGSITTSQGTFAFDPATIFLSQPLFAWDPSQITDMSYDWVSGSHLAAFGENEADFGFVNFVGSGTLAGITTYDESGSWLAAPAS